MSKPNHTAIPSALQEAFSQKSAEEQERLRQTWQLLGHLESEDFDLPDLNIPDTEIALADLEAAIDAGPKSDGPAIGNSHRFASDRPARSSHTNQRSSAMRWTTAAATACVLLFATMIFLWRTPVAVRAPLGEQVSVVLPDQSVITLNSGSRLEYARRFESWPLIATPKRRVFLQGEAFFEIQKSQKPFVVETFNAQVRVLGTSFNVWARQHDMEPETRVTLSTGTVLVTQHENLDEASNIEETRTTTLQEPGQTVRVKTTVDGISEHIESTIQTHRISAWRTQGMSATGIPLGSVIAEIERQYAITIRIDEKIDASHKMAFYIQKKPSVEKIIEDICLSMGCEYRPTNNGFDIFPSVAP